MTENCIYLKTDLSSILHYHPLWPSNNLEVNWTLIINVIGVLNNEHIGVGYVLVCDKFTGQAVVGISESFYKTILPFSRVFCLFVFLNIISSVWHLNIFNQECLHCIFYLKRAVTMFMLYGHNFGNMYARFKESLVGFNSHTYW